MQLLDIQQLALVEEPEHAPPDTCLECDVLVVGGGLGGCAAALAVAGTGHRVVLTEETDWPGGQLTSQGVSAPDEHRFIEEFGGTRSYQALRARIREAYATSFQLSDAALRAPQFNPGNGWVSRLCFEPEVGAEVLRTALAEHEASGRLTVLYRYKAVHAEVRDHRVESVVLRHLDSERRCEVRASFVLDATELGDLLPLTGAEYVCGAESRANTGEPSAPKKPHPEWVQSFTYTFALRREPTAGNPEPEPDDYEEDRDRQPFTLRHFYHDGRGWVTYRMFDTGAGAAGPFWTYRRLIDRDNFRDPRQAVDRAMINWPGNDFRGGSLIDVEPATALRALQRAASLSLGFCRWIQTACPRDEGGFGYPELQLDPTVMGTPNGLSRFPYIRESRRLKTLRTVRQQDISAVYQPDARAAAVPDSGGVGYYAIDIHPAEGETRLPPEAARPFQIPLGALIPVGLRNLLPAAKNLGVTHITNGAFRLHPVEWNIGETAGLLAAHCLERNLEPRGLLGDPRRLRRFQRRLVRAGVPLYWWVDVGLDHPAFEATQLLAAWGAWPGDSQHLEFRPNERAGAAALTALTAAPGWRRPVLERVLQEWLPRWGVLDRATLAQLVYEAFCLERL